MIKLRCPNGHKLSAQESQAGSRALCPKCQAKVLVPRPEAKISDTSIMAVLGDYGGDQAIVTRAVLAAKPESRRHAPVKMKNCPRCRELMTLRYQICPKCRLYLPENYGIKA